MDDRDDDGTDDYVQDLVPGQPGVNVGTIDQPFSIVYADNVIVSDTSSTNLFATYNTSNTNCSARFRAQGGSGTNAVISIECGDQTRSVNVPAPGGFLVGPWGATRGGANYWWLTDSTGSFQMNPSSATTMKPNNNGGLYVPTAAPTNILAGKIWYNGTNLCVGTGTGTFKTATLS